MPKNGKALYFSFLFFFTFFPLLILWRSVYFKMDEINIPSNLIKLLEGKFNLYLNKKVNIYILENLK